VFGCGALGYKDDVGAGTLGNKDEVQAIFDEFKRHGHTQLDTARLYSEGTSETLVGDLYYEKQGFTVGTKVHSFTAGSHTPENIARSVVESLHELKAKKVHILYLHHPDRTVPLDVVLGAINEEHKKGHFEEFGISNYSPEEVEKIVQITSEKGYVRPTVYQGLYNLLVRGGEESFFPLLRKHGIRFYAYSPLGGSFLTDVPSRLDPNTPIGKYYYDKSLAKESHIKAHERLLELGHKYGLRVSEIAFRWLAHHSHLSPEHHDAIVIGGKTFSRIKEALDDIDKPVLPEEIVRAIDEIWIVIKHDATPFHA